VDEQGQALTNQAISIMPVSVGYPQAEPVGPYFADRKGKVLIGPVPPGEHQYVLRQGWPVPTIVSLNAPLAGEAKTEVKVKKGELLGGTPDLDIKVKVREEKGTRSLDLTITGNTDKPYALSSTDLQLVSGEYRIFPPPGKVPNDAVVPAKGSYQLVLDWDSYLHRGIWVSRRGEDIDEKSPVTPAGAGLAYYRVDAGNCYSLPFALPALDKVQGQVLHHSGKGLAGATMYLVSGQHLQLVNGQPGGGHWSNGRLERFGGSAGAKTITDKDGRFTLTAVAGDRLVVVAGDTVWLAPLQTAKEQTIQLPQPGKVTISYDIAGAAKDGVIRLQLMTWDLPDRKSVV
jgi:hypothetical protein